MRRHPGHPHDAQVTFIVHIDEVLDEAGLNLSKFTKALQWLAPVRPSSYRNVSRKLAERVAAMEQSTAN